MCAFSAVRKSRYEVIVCDFYLISAVMNASVMEVLTAFGTRHKDSTLIHLK